MTEVSRLAAAQESLLNVRKSDILTFGNDMAEVSKVGRHGTIALPAKLRRRYGIDEGTMVTAEEVPSGILIRPAAVLPVEIYTPERKAEFLLSNAVDKADYLAAREEVRQMGLDPTKIPHRKPPRR